MNTDNTSRFILHVSDFHLTDTQDEIEQAQDALKALVTKLSSEKIKVDYLVHTGDVIDSSDLYEKTAHELNLGEEFFSFKGEKVLFNKTIFCEKADEQQKNDFNSKLKKLTESRFKKAEEVLRKFISDLNIPLGNVVICSGNHDVLRLLSIDDTPVICEKDEDDKWAYQSPDYLKDSFTPFENFLDNLEIANSRKRCNSNESVTQCTIDNLNFLLLNTNWKNPTDQKQGYFCVRCDIVNTKISELSISQDILNIVLAHKPIYEICEQARLSYQRYIQTPFMSNLRKFIGKNGIYLCGDKHTRSIVGSQFHDIPNYIGGEPLNAKTNGEVEYNLLELSEGKLGMERKIHLKNRPVATSKEQFNWECDIRPQDNVVSKLYDLSKKYIIDEAFEIIEIDKNPNSWESICQTTHDWERVRSQPWYKNFNKLYQAICKYRKEGSDETSLDDKDIFDFVCERLNHQMKRSVSKNILNIRGEYSSGKSLFLGLFYIYLLNQYSVGKIDFIPAYFNLENEEMPENIKSSSSYFDAVTETFSEYAKEIQKTAIKEHQTICFIIDGLDEQDCWSYSTEDSIGRALLDVLSQYSNSWYVMSFGQHRLPCFKNTMPTRKYNDSSDIMYFNPIDVREKESEDSRFSSFIKSFFKMQPSSGMPLNYLNCVFKLPEINDNFVEQVCEVIRNFRRLTITPGFMYENLKYIVEQSQTIYDHNSNFVSEIYNYYIDHQYEICLDKLGYNFVKYAPVMAYLFSFKGYTYEKFKYLRGDSNINHSHMFKPICEHYDQMYHTFLFIKKHRDAREYLIALHYNRELRYYAEHPTEPIDSNSILNEFISRNIAVVIRKLWTDTNKFLIACEILLQRNDLPACTLSILVYCLAHLNMYTPIRDQLRKQIQNKGEMFLQENNCADWNIKNNDSVEKLNQFINLSLKHSIEIFRLIDSNNSIQLVGFLISDETFRKYNRQFQMLYYEDLSIRGEETKRALNPGLDLVYKGFDFHNCFYYLYMKLVSPHSYPLREFDMFTLWDLIHSRLMANTLDCHTSDADLETFFYREKFSQRANMVLTHTWKIFETYLTNCSHDDVTASMFSYFKNVRDTLDEIIAVKGNKTKSYSNIINILKKFDEKNAQLYPGNKSS